MYVCTLCTCIIIRLQEGAAPLADEASTVPRVSAKEIKEKIGIKSIFIVDTRSVCYNYKYLISNFNSLCS